MTYIGDRDLFLEISKGNVAGHASVNKFGRTKDADLSTLRDIYETATDIWVAPTTARTHTIASTSTADDFSDSGTGARTIRIYGLTGWGAAEVNEDIELDGNGTNTQTTSNTYVIIHRMKVLTTGTGGTNAGTITATAQSDATITAQIDIGQGQTQMAIYGIPSTQKAYMTNYYFSTNKSGGAALLADVQIVVNPEPDVQLAHFNVKHTQSISAGASNFIRHNFEPYFQVTGPAIIKAQVTANANESDVSAGFDLILVDN